MDEQDGRGRRGAAQAGASRSSGLAARNAARERLAANPFYVLELRPACSRAEVERAGQKLLGMLELDLSAARRYRSPLGSHARTPELVRASMAELRDPDRRLLHELWARLDPAAPTGAAAADAGTVDASAGDAEPARGDEDQAHELLRPFAALRALGFGDWSRRG